MAHEIEMKDGKASFAYTGGAPWHGLGHELPQAFTKDQALEFSGQSWHVYKAPMYIEQDGLAVNIPDQFAICRDDVAAPGNVLGTTGKVYIPIQNEQIYEIGDMLVGEGAAVWHTAGVLRGGQIVFATLKLPDSIEVADGDMIDKYLVVVNWHTGKSAAKLYFSPIRVVCMNTLQASLMAGGIKARICHSGDLSWQFRNAADLIGISDKVFSKTADASRELVKVKLSTEQVRGYIWNVFPDLPGKALKRKSNKTERIRDIVEHLYREGKGNDLPSVRGTAWAAYNAVTEYVDHARLQKSGRERRFASSWFGTGTEIRQRAYKYAMAMV